jgi:hypothetical protein
VSIDEQVAAALGWERLIENRPPAYSTDWSLLPQLLAWLKQRGLDVTINVMRDVCTFAEAFQPGRAGEASKADGVYVPDAICRLVLAVRAREEGK